MNQEKISKKSIQALRHIAIRLSEFANAIIKQLSSFITLQDYITNEVIIVFKDILRKDPIHIEDCLEIQQSDSFTDQILKQPSSTSQASLELKFLWLHIFFRHLQEAAESVELKHTLLTSCIKVFLCRAPELQEVLGKLFYNIINNENEDIDLKDRAAFYYRTLQNNPNGLKKLWQYGIKVDKFLEEQNINKEALLFEFNSLSVIYEKNVNKYITSFEYFNNVRNKELQDQNQENQQTSTEKQEPIQDGFDREQIQTAQNTPNLMEIANNLRNNWRIIVEDFERMQINLSNGAYFTSSWQEVTSLMKIRYYIIQQLGRKIIYYRCIFMEHIMSDVF